MGTVTLDGRELTGWKSYSLPMKSPADIAHWSKNERGGSEHGGVGPAFYRGTIKLDRVTDTYLDTSSLTKGFVWINGHNLGRTWNIGPQKSLFVPAPWLHRGENEVVVFDYADQPATSLHGLSEPLWSK